MRQLKVVKSITNRDSIVEKYLQEISRIEMLTQEEEILLTQRIKMGEQEAVTLLTRGNLRFVVSVAKQYQYRGFPLSDLINEGNIGLIKAARNFDETKGFKFISYAVWWIRQSITQAINDQSRMVRLPSNKIQLGNKVQTSTSRLEQELEREPSTEEIAMQLEVAVEDITQVQGNRVHLSLDSPMGDESSDGTLLDRLDNHNIVSTDAAVHYTKSLQIEIKRCLGTLPIIQKEVLRLYFGIEQSRPMLLSEIAVMFNLSEERIRQLKQKALIQLRSGKRYQLLKPFLCQV